MLLNMSCDGQLGTRSSSLQALVVAGNGHAVVRTKHTCAFVTHAFRTLG